MQRNGRSLTAAQRLFAIERAKGKSLVQAYRIAYPRARGTDQTVQVDAWRVEQRSSVVLLIMKIQEEATAKAVNSVAITKEQIIAELWQNSQIAKAAVPVLDAKGKPTGVYNANITASNNALIAIGKDLGMFRENPEKPDPLADLTHEQVKELKDALDAFDAAEAETNTSKGRH